MREKIIKAPIGNVTLLAKIFNVSRVTVSDALKFKTNSELANRIRNFAIDTKEVGGKLYEIKKTGFNHN